MSSICWCWSSHRHLLGSAEALDAGQPHVPACGGAHARLLRLTQRRAKNLTLKVAPTIMGTDASMLAPGVGELPGVVVENFIECGQSDPVNPDRIP
jgi:hypothetical protein